MQHIIQERSKSATEQYENQIKEQQKQIDDLKFFQDLDLDKATTNANANTKSIAIANATKLEQMEAQLHKSLADNTHLSQQITQLKSHNIDLQANLHACNPPMSTPDAYKKALRLQSELLDARNLMQEEVLGRERAETNLQCVQMESDSRINEKGNLIKDLEKALEERVKDLDDGVAIMKSLEEEMFGVQTTLEEERGLNSELKQKFEAFEMEKNSLAEKLRSELEASKQKVKDMEDRFDREKGELEDNCDDLMQEIENMKGRINDMEMKRKLKDETIQGLEQVEKEHREMISTMKKDHNAEMDQLKASAEEHAADAKASKEKIEAMEEVVSMYHEKARREIQEFATRAEEASKEETAARQQLQECLLKVDEAEKEIDSLLNDMEFMQKELVEKEAILEDLEKSHSELSEKCAELSETSRANTTAKAKEHQHMREKKKWSSTEKTLREELANIRQQCSEFRSENKALSSERNELDQVYSQMEEENHFLKKEMTSMEENLEEYSKTLENVEEESTSRTKSLEQELVRLQNMNIVRPSPRPSAQFEEMKTALQSKNKEIERVQKMADAAMNEVRALKRTSNPSPHFEDLTPRIKNSSPTFNAFNTDENEAKRHTSASSSPSKLEWDEMDNLSTSRKANAAEVVETSSAIQSRRDDGTPDFVKQERRAIENDAIRSYMRHRRRQKRLS